MVKPMIVWNGIFLLAMMAKLGFSHYWIELVEKCVTTPAFALIVNGTREEGGSLKVKRGLPLVSVLISVFVINIDFIVIFII